MEGAQPQDIHIAHQGCFLNQLLHVSLIAVPGNYHKVKANLQKYPGLNKYETSFN